MNPTTKPNLTQTTADPCLQIQVDLSAMLDGELEKASVRRVLVHADLCPSCRMFLQAIRTHVQAHADLHAIFEGGDLGTVDLEPSSGSGDAGAWQVEPRQVDPRQVDPRQGDPRQIGSRPAGSRLATELRQKLLESRSALARILYELGRGHVLLGTSPNFYRAVAREPVPIPDVCMRGRSLLDEVNRLAPALANDAARHEWVRARLLFDGSKLSSPRANLEKGVTLLREALVLSPRYHEARIYLGHAYHIEHERDLARHEFRVVLANTDDPIVRAFALENLGNVDLEEGFPDRAIPHFLALVESGVVTREPRFFTTYFNLALAHGLLAEFAACTEWLARLHDEFPHKRRIIGNELRTRSQFAAAVARRPDVAAAMARDFPVWFPITTSETGS